MILSDEQKFKKKVREYKHFPNCYLMTSRFNNQTWEENKQFRHSKNSSGNNKIGCVYCSPRPLNHEIPYNAILFILEMNNDINKIMGIGMVKYDPKIFTNIVYNNKSYNRYSFWGTRRIDVSEMNEEEKQIIKVLDILCFTGNSHSKRGDGIKTFPYDMLYRMSFRLDIVQFIKHMFIKRQ